MKNFCKKNSDNIIILTIGALILMLIYNFLLFVIDQFNNKIDGAIGDYFNGIVAPFISVLSATLIYISFREQVKANKLQMKLLDDERMISKIDRYFRMIEEIDKYEQKITYKIDIDIESIEYNSIKAIDKYIQELNRLKAVKMPVNYSNKQEFQRSFITYLSNILFILAHIEQIRNINNDYFTMLSSKFFLETPDLYNRLRDLSQFKNEITNNNKDILGGHLYEFIRRAENSIDSHVKKNEYEE